MSLRLLRQARKRKRVERQPGLAARGESLAAFDGRCLPADCVAPRSNTPGILGRRALPAGRLARLGATPGFHHGLLTVAPVNWPTAPSVVCAALRPRRKSLSL